MKIHKIELENYRQYRGKQTVELSVDDSRTLNIILGPNGTGKTNLLNAINWCLYGNEPSLQKTRPELQQCIANEKELSERKHVAVCVGIYIGDDFPEYYFERKISTYKTPGGFMEEEKTWLVSHREGKNWRNHSGSDWRNMTQFNNLVSDILPEGISDFFFFDGERLDDFFRKGLEHEVKKAIIKVCQIELLDRCIDHLEIRLREYTKIKGASPRVDDIHDEKEILTESKKKLEEDIERLNDSIKEANKNKEDIEDKLRGISTGNADILQNERDELEIEIDKLDKEIEEKEKKIRNHFISNIIFVYGFDALQKTHNMLNRRIEKIDKPAIPPEIEDVFIKSLLSRNLCICGTDLPKGSQRRKNVEELLNSVESSSKVSKDATNGYYKIPPVLKKCKTFKSERRVLKREYQELCDERKRKDERLKEISEQLKGIPVDEIQNMENLRDNYEDEIRKCIAERSQKELIWQTTEEKIKLKNMELLREIEKDKKYKKALLKIELCNKSIDILKKIKEKVVKEIREKVEQKTKEYFFDLHWKKEAFRDVKINDNYEISVINQVGSECLGTISSGERQILALSFMAALSSVSGFNAPVIIDTPLGRISGKPKEKIAKSLPKYLENSQLTLLITDQEYTPTVSNHMKERIGKEFELQHDEEEMNTEIVKVGE